MRLKDIDDEIGTSYTTYGDINIRDNLIIPALKHATLYRRSVGYFSSGSLITIIDGITSLIKRKGKIQIICSPILSSEDIKTIELGYKLREKVIEEHFFVDFNSAIAELDDDKLEILAELIARDDMEIKIVDITDEDAKKSNGFYHDKVGIITDSYGDSVVFVGSPNETLQGLGGINYEKVRVFKTWAAGSNVFAEEEIEDFENNWNGKNPYLKTYQFREAIKTEVIRETEKRKNDSSVESKKPIKLRDYQQEAVNAWVNNNYHGFYIMATGTGKTWTSIFAAQELMKTENVMTVVIAPYIHLVKQWERDISKMFPKATVIMVFGSYTNWYSTLQERIIYNKRHPEEQIIVVSTIASFEGDRFQRLIRKSKQKKLLIADEAHRFSNRNEEYKTIFSYMLGLSATPFNGKNVESGKSLVDFFGGCVYELPIEKALEKGFLLPYNYHPIFLNALDDEEEKFKQLTQVMLSCYRNNVLVDKDKFILAHKARLRVIAMADEKISKIDYLIDQIDKKDHLIVYSGDGRVFDTDNDEMRHIDFIKNHLNAKGYKASQFTAQENMKERMALIECFNRSEITALAAIRCLDEGVDIPSIKSALILASNDDYREFTQRRGRILRKDGLKESADIYDVIILPSLENKAFATIELRRFLEYGRLSSNWNDTMPKLENLMQDYDLEYEDIDFNLDDMLEREDELDD